MRETKPPHDIELERALLGYLISEPASFDLVRPIIASLEYFYWQQHRTIYAAMLDLDASREKEQWDEIAIGSFIKKSGKLQSVGGYQYLAEIADRAPSKCNPAFYAKLLRETHAGIKAAAICDGLKASLSRKGDDSVSIVDAVSGTVSKLQALQASLGATKNKIRTVSEIMPAVYREIEETLNGNLSPSIKTGLGDLDKLLGGGFYRGEFNILGARPSVGKTTLAINISDYCSPGTRVLLISIESSGESIVRDRLLPLKSGISSVNLRNPVNMTKNEWDMLGESAGVFGKYKNFKICDKSAATIEDIELLVAPVSRKINYAL